MLLLPGHPGQRKEREDNWIMLRPVLYVESAIIMILMYSIMQDYRRNPKYREPDGRLNSDYKVSAVVCFVWMMLQVYKIVTLFASR